MIGVIFIGNIHRKLLPFGRNLPLICSFLQSINAGKKPRFKPLCMPKKLMLTGIFIWMALCVQAQLNFFSPDSIPPALKKNAHSIKQYEKNEFIVTDIGKAVYKTRQVITVLDKQGDNHLFFYEYTDAFRKLDDIQVTVFGPLGIPVKKYLKKDFEQEASGGGLVEDGWYYHLRLAAPSYPFTVEYSSTIKYKGLINYPSFSIQEVDQSVKYAQYSITVPSQLGLRYQNQHTAIHPKITEEGPNKTYQWEVENIPAVQYEEGSGGWSRQLAKVWVGPSKFELDGYPGEMTSWNSFGKWIGDLAAKSLNLTPQQKTYIQSLVAQAKTPEEKVRILYQHLQNNFRYISIQLGIGGLRPFPAAFTDDKKYGDCKALSNYMQACLEAVGIRSHKAAINSDYNSAPVDSGFPINGFNHMILCVPMQPDSIWLECTSKTNEFGILGNFTENRNALLITENGGVLVRTPSSKASNNLFSIKATVKLAEDGSGQVSTQLAATGEDREALLSLLQNESADDQKSGMMYLLKMPVPDRFSAELSSDTKATNQQASLQLSFEKIAAFTAGSKMFLHPQFHKIWTSYLPKTTNRQLDYYFHYPFEKNDTTVYQLPEGYKVESLPPATSFNCTYGSYQSKTWYDEATNSIVNAAKLVLEQYKIPPAQYSNTYDFFGKVIGDEVNKIVIKRL